jgi:hypothetical protein
VKRSLLIEGSQYHELQDQRVGDGTLGSRGACRGGYRRGWCSVQLASVQVRWSRPAEMVWISPVIQHVGQPRSTTMPGAASRSAAGPTLGVSASAAPMSPKPIAPRVRWRAREVLASGLRRWSGILGAFWAGRVVW